MTARPDADRRWFDETGWKLTHDELNAELKSRGVADDTRVDWLDEAATRRDQAKAAAERPADLVITVAEQLLGALLFSGAYGPDLAARKLEQVRAAGVTAAVFQRERDRHVYEAIERVVDAGSSCEFFAVEAELKKAGRLDQAGGPGYIRSLASLVPEVENAATYARLVVDEHIRYEQSRLALELQRAAGNGGVTPELREQLIRILEPPLELGQSPEAVGGGRFVFDEPVDIDSTRIWGRDAAIAWAAGEALMIVGPDGVGKTTVMQQLVLARAGLRTDALGMHVQPDPTGVLYIAADRPRQAARSIRRMVADSERDQLDQTMTFWKGPLPQLLNEDRTILTRLARQFGRNTIAIDSLKDVAVDISKDESGGRIATAFQHAIANGIEIVCAHHPRKPGVEQVRKPRELSDVYGSRLIFGVFGSVIMLWGDPGDVLVELSHLKQPIEELGPWNILHDHRRGHTTVEHGKDLLDVVLAAGTSGVTAKSAAEQVYETETPTKQQVHRIRGRLDRLADADKVTKIPSVRVGGEVRFFYNGPAEVLTR